LREENTVQRDISGCVREEVKNDWRKYLSEELHDLYCSSNVDIVVTKSRTDGRGMWHLGGRRKMHIGLWWGNSKERGHWEYVSVDGGITLTALNKYAGRT